MASPEGAQLDSQEEDWKQIKDPQARASALIKKVMAGEHGAFARVDNEPLHRALSTPNPNHVEQE